MTTATTVPVLGEALRFVQMTGIFYCPSELTEPWGLELPPMDDCLWFHVATHGSCTIEVDDGETQTLQPGDLALVPHGRGHRLLGSQPAPTPSVFDLPHEYVGENYGVLRHGGEGERTNLVCGGVRFDHPTSRHLLEAMPALVLVKTSQSPRADWMRATLDLIAEETQHVRPGSDAVVSRLCDILVIQGLRTWIEQDPAAQTGWIGALHDHQIGHAIARIHADPAHDWTVAGLAEEVAMSRSAFAARFSELVGEAAMRYVTRWRMHLAFDLLQGGDTTVAAVGREVGYDSEAAFSRAFKRVMGTPPRGRIAS
jgi:AraC-like DNA-binding protein